MVAFRQGLADAGIVEGKNATIGMLSAARK